jgi:hypothetical protein
MANADPRARVIAELLTDCNVPQKSDLHIAVHNARIEDEACLIERFAAFAGVSLDEMVEKAKQAQQSALALLAAAQVEIDA